MEIKPDSTFAVPVDLRVGPNSLTLSLADPAGNRVERSFLVRRSQEP